MKRERLALIAAIGVWLACLGSGMFSLTLLEGQHAPTDRTAVFGCSLRDRASQQE